MFETLNKLNRSKYFLGFFIILLNIGSKFISLRLNSFHEKLLKDTIGRQLMVFAICFVGTRDILVAFVMSSLFFVLNDYLFNEKSTLCIIPKKYQRQLKASIDTNKYEIIDENDIKEANRILNKAKKQKQKEIQRNAYMTFMNNL